MFLILIAIRNPNSYPIFAQGPKVNLMPEADTAGTKSIKRKDVYLDPPVVVKEVRMLFHQLLQVDQCLCVLGSHGVFFSCALKTWPVLDDGCHLCHQWNAWMILEVETFRYTIIYQNTMNGCGQDALLFLLSCKFMQHAMFVGVKRISSRTFLGLFNLSVHRAGVSIGQPLLKLRVAQPSERVS